MWRILTSYYLNTYFYFFSDYKVFNIRQENTGTDLYLTNMVQIYKHAVPLEYGAAARSYIPTL